MLILLQNMEAKKRNCCDPGRYGSVSVGLYINRWWIRFLVRVHIQVLGSNPMQQLIDISLSPLSICTSLSLSPSIPHSKKLI